jgi:two-component system nitrate/nitrite response regulator NarL
MFGANFTFKKVLLIDDSEIDVLVNRRLMELTHFASEVYVTGTAEEGLHFLREECRSKDDAPDWIFLDMNLPMMSGYDFIEEFKLLPDFITLHTKVIVLSVFQKPERLKKVFENKFIYGQLDKPLTQSALRDLAERKPLPISVSF